MAQAARLLVRPHHAPRAVKSHLVERMGPLMGVLRNMQMRFPKSCVIERASQGLGLHSQFHLDLLPRPDLPKNTMNRGALNRGSINNTLKQLRKSGFPFSYSQPFFNKPHRYLLIWHCEAGESTIDKQATTAGWQNILLFMAYSHFRQLFWEEFPPSWFGSTVHYEVPGTSTTM